MRWLVKTVAAVFAGLLATGVASGSSQEPDVLLFDDQELELDSNPLAEWLAMHPGRLQRGDAGFENNWRGYVATWEIAHDRLWLRQVAVRFRKDEGSGQARYELRDQRPALFPGSGRVTADWYTGTLVVPLG